MFTNPPSIEFPFSRPPSADLHDPSVWPLFHPLSTSELLPSNFHFSVLLLIHELSPGKVLPQSSSHSLSERIPPSANVYDPSIFQSLPFFQSLPTSAEPNPLLAHWDNTAQQKGADDKYDALATLNMNCECNDKYDAQEKTNTNKSAALMTKN